MKPDRLKTGTVSPSLSAVGWIHAGFSPLWFILTKDKQEKDVFYSSVGSFGARPLHSVNIRARTQRSCLMRPVRGYKLHPLQWDGRYRRYLSLPVRTLHWLSLLCLHRWRDDGCLKLCCMKAAENNCCVCSMCDSPELHLKVILTLYLYITYGILYI